MTKEHCADCDQVVETIVNKRTVVTDKKDRLIVQFDRQDARGTYHPEPICPKCAAKRLGK